VLSGTWGAPTGEGEFEVEDVELRFEAGLPPFESVDGLARFEGTRLRFERWKGELAGGPFEFGGSIDFAGRQAVFDVGLVGSELLLVRRRDLRVRADADLRLRGPRHELALEGTLRTRDSRWTRDVDWFRRGSGAAPRPARGPLFSIESGPFATLRFDVAIDSLEPLTIDTNLARGGLRGDLHLGGTGREPELSGVLYVDPTRVFLPASTLELRGGTLSLDRQAPLDPRLDLQLGARARGYDVTVTIGGRYSEPEVEFASAPPLPAEDILVLLLTGRPPGETLTGETGVEAAETVIVYLGRDLVSRWFEGDDVSLLERVEWQTGADVTQAGGQTAQVSIRLVGEPEGEGRAIYLRGEKDVYDRINYGLRFVLRLR
jgi:translocation and assembly module TamB